VKDESWIKLYRKLLDKPIWKKSSPEHKTILITLLLMANHEKSEWEWMGKEFEVLPGQFVTSLESIRERAGNGISLQNVRSALLKFQKLGFLTYESTKSGRKITIIKWSSYQSKDIEANKHTNKEVTKGQQRGNKEVTTNKNDKNDKNCILFAQSRDELDSTQDVFLAIPLKPSDGYAGITHDFLAEWQELFPAVDVKQELRHILAWNNANPKRRKSRGGILKHITHWLTDRQDKSRRNISGGSQTPRNKSQILSDGSMSIAAYNTLKAGEEWINEG